MTRRRSERGHGLLTALLVLLLVSIAISLLASTLHRELRLVQQEAAAVDLRALSDAALAEALAELGRDRKFAGLPEHPFGAGTLACEVTPVSTHEYRIRASAWLGKPSPSRPNRVIEAQVRRIDGWLRVTAWRKISATEEAK